MYRACALVAIWAFTQTAATHAQSASPQGIWAVGGASACGTGAVLIRAHDRVWEFTDMTGQSRAQQVVRATGRDVVTRSDGAVWAYHFVTPASARVTELWSQRSFTLVRCAADSLVRAEAPPLDPARD